MDVAYLQSGVLIAYLAMHRRSIGADPNDVAVAILNSIVSGKTDFVVASNLSARAAIWLRLFIALLSQFNVGKEIRKIPRGKRLTRYLF